MEKGGRVGMVDSLGGWHLVAMAEVERELNALCNHPAVEPTVREILCYTVFPPGKRLRPLLLLALGQDLGVPLKQLLPAAAALELLHGASLIHDDLPAIDNDDFRRGRPSSHRVFGEGHALLAGDLAVPLAFQWLLNADLPATTKLLLSNELSAAYLQLCNGQHLDLLTGEARGDILSLYAKKTGALFGAACVAAACIAGLPDKVRDESRRFGIELGVLFQLHDDSIDNLPEKGRAKGSDTRNKKELADSSVGSKVVAAARDRTTEALARVELTIIESEVARTLQRTRELLSSLYSS
ncbi:MAG: hypothetical protein EBZ48_00410 [Proteobacteria bacterium]|nr:hypothetical protein [Pseudomonadota bacterium]